MSAPLLSLPVLPTLWRWPVLWIGLCAVIFTGWVWADSVFFSSMAAYSHSCDEAFVVGSGGGLLRLHREVDMQPPAFRAHGMWVARRYSPPSFAAGAKAADIYSPPGYHFTRYPSYPGSDPSVLDVVIPAWGPLALAVSAWGAAILLRLRRLRKWGMERAHPTLAAGPEAAAGLHLDP